MKSSVDKINDKIKSGEKTLNIVEGLLVKYRHPVVFVIHIMASFASYFIAFGIRFDLTIPHQYLEMLLRTLPFLFIARASSSIYYGTYYISFKYFDTGDFLEIAKSVLSGSLLFILLVVFFDEIYDFPRSVFVLEGVLNVVILYLIAVIRKIQWSDTNYSEKKKRNLLIVGAGKAGVMVYNEIRAKKNLGYRIVGFVDDDKYKQKTYIQGIPVLGSTEELEIIIKNYSVDEVIIAIPSAPYKRIMEIKGNLDLQPVKVQVLPRLERIIKGDSLLGQLRDLPLEEVLHRKPIKFSRESDKRNLFREIEGNVVFVSGAGGSIGTELCRQIIQYNPSLIIGYERHENSLHDLDCNIRFEMSKGKENICEFVPVIGDVGDVKKLEEIFNKYKVDIVFHAAAYKHVPIMEREPVEAVRNNVIGTYTIGLCAKNNNVKTFINISTDKAVNPTNIMGTTKRCCEKIVQELNGGSTKFISVRFGNVLDSNGSVIPLFRRQIASGGPVTVTDPEVTRYFMSIPEAVQLVLVAMTMGKGGEIFLLDMGKPVKILELAEIMIKRAGLTPGRDIEIVYTGLRRGEKLHEELYWEGEGIVPTDNRRITVLLPNGEKEGRVGEWIKELNECIDKKDVRALVHTLKNIVPEAEIEPSCWEQI